MSIVSFYIRWVCCRRCYNHKEKTETLLQLKCHWQHQAGCVTGVFNTSASEERKTWQRIDGNICISQYLTTVYITFLAKLHAIRFHVCRDWVWIGGQLWVFGCTRQWVYSLVSTDMDDDILRCNHNIDFQQAFFFTKIWHLLLRNFTHYMQNASIFRGPSALPGL